MDASTPTAPAEAQAVIMSRGLKFPKHPAVNRPRIRKALRQNTYEGLEADAVMKIAREGDTVIELGAGIGYISTLIAAKKPVKEIHSFEANPHLIDYIRSAHAANNVTNVTVHNAILAPQTSAPVDFYVRQNLLASSLDKDATNTAAITSVEKVEVRDINETFATLQPDVLVCDIEGAEADILPALNYDGLRAAVLELHPQWIGAPGVRAVFEAMHRAGLTYFPRWSHRKVVVFRREW
ncbi:FkbM family methyltransferase [Marimonas lutisalis]|uniref:FkbM family methyltransferase n=1 Tax=Marimonas lutisalis TaxID=2545756 RepID=UPI0010F67BA1|nr:FkbM family methyltransferase [Marimonas lutisalis]